MGLVSNTRKFLKKYESELEEIAKAAGEDFNKVYPGRMVHEDKKRSGYSPREIYYMAKNAYSSRFLSDFGYWFADIEQRIRMKQVCDCVGQHPNYLSDYLSLKEEEKEEVKDFDLKNYDHVVAKYGPWMRNFSRRVIEEFSKENPVKIEMSDELKAEIIEIMQSGGEKKMKEELKKEELKVVKPSDELDILRYVLLGDIGWRLTMNTVV